MPETAIWYFDVVSPFSYLQLARFGELPKDLKVEPRPVLFAGLLRHWGQLGPVEVAPKRLHTYRMAQWFAQQNGIPLRWPPAHPFNPLPVLRLLVALGAPLDSVRTAFDLIWREGRDANEPDVWRELGRRLGVANADELAASESAKASLRANTEAAVAQGVFGVPSFVLGGEIFWGNDALDMLNAFVRDPTLFTHGEMGRLRALPFGSERRKA